MNDKTNTQPAADKKDGAKNSPIVASAPAAELPMNHPDAPHITIHLQKGEGDDEKDGVYVSINGNDFMVPRAVDVSVPVPVYEVLANAKRVQLSEDGSESFEHNRFSLQIKSPISVLARA
jgi:hypothetical protein